MKLKEKLAQDAYVKHLQEHGGYDYRDSEQWFIAGFEKAREMAIQLWRDSEQTGMRDFLDLGEEEV